MEMPTEMQHQVMGYDRAATMFSPEGHLLQVEYAEKTVRLGPSSIGLVCTDGVVIIADRRIRDPLVTTDSASKTYEVDEHIIAVLAGIVSDGRILIDRAQITAQQHRVTYDAPIEVEAVIKEIANTKQLFTQYGGARPFGVSIMVAGINNKKAKLFVSDVTGNYFGYNAMAIGENDERIKEMLREDYNEKIDVEQGIKLSFKIFKKILGKNFEIERFDVGFIKKDNPKVQKLSGDSLKKFLK